MSPKKLPKAITRPSLDSPGTDAPPEARERRTRRRRSSSKTPALDETAPHPAAPAAIPEEKSPSEAPPAPVEGQLLPPMQVGTPTHDARRRAAEKIVERYKLYAALGALSPLPFVTAAGVTAVILRMVKMLSDLYQVPFERDLTRSIIIGVMGGAVPTGLGVATASTLALALPGVGFIGVAVSSLTAAAATERIGFIFIERFEPDHSPAPVPQTKD